MEGKRRERAVTGKWVKRLGALGFLFFLAKGLVWLGVAAAASLGMVAAL